MKRIIICLALVLASSFNVMKAQNVGVEIDLEVGIFDPTGSHEPPHKGPVVVPSVSLECHTLIFATPCDGCLLRLLDENGAVVYSTIIPVGATSLVLPSYLSGNYEIQIVQGNICFWGYIYL